MKNKLFHSNLWKWLLTGTQSQCLIVFLVLNFWKGDPPHEETSLSIGNGENCFPRDSGGRFKRENSAEMKIQATDF